MYSDYTDEELRKMAEGVYAGTDTQREGIVVRPIEVIRIDGRRLSFKVLNLNYKN